MLTDGSQHTDINPWRRRGGLEARMVPRKHGASSHELLDDLVSVNKHPMFVLAFEVLSVFDGAVVFALGPGNQERTNM